MTKSSTKNSNISGRFQPGQSGNPAGRPVGTKNRFSALKEAFVEAFDGVGGVDSLIEWAKDNPDKFYPLLARLFPKEVAVESKSSADLHVSMLEMNRALRRIGKPEIQECED